MIFVKNMGTDCLRREQAPVLRVKMGIVLNFFVKILCWGRSCGGFML